jgi:hypothetical protein
MYVRSDGSDSYSVKSRFTSIENYRTDLLITEDYFIISDIIDIRFLYSTDFS